LSELSEKLEINVILVSYVAVLHVLIHVNGVQDTVEESSFFYKIIDFGELLKQV
jgi:hypothetical protein